VTHQRPRLNPLRSEAEAFRFLVAVACYCGAIGLASVLGGGWAALAVFLALTGAVALRLLRR
jgi:fatty acid desaturase